MAETTLKLRLVGSQTLFLWAEKRLKIEDKRLPDIFIYYMMLVCHTTEVLMFDVFFLKFLMVLEETLPTLNHELKCSIGIEKQHRHQVVVSQIRKSLLIILDFNLDIAVEDFVVF